MHPTPGSFHYFLRGPQNNLTSARNLVLWLPPPARYR